MANATWEWEGLESKRPPMQSWCRPLHLITTFINLNITMSNLVAERGFDISETFSDHVIFCIRLLSRSLHRSSTTSSSSSSSVTERHGAHLSSLERVILLCDEFDSTQRVVAVALRLRQRVDGVLSAVLQQSLIVAEVDVDAATSCRRANSRRWINKWAACRRTADAICRAGGRYQPVDRLSRAPWPDGSLLTRWRRHGTVPWPQFDVTHHWFHRVRVGSAFVPFINSG